MTQTILPEVVRLQQTVRLAALLRGASFAAIALAAVAGTALIVLRLFGVWVAPQPWWFALLVVPVGWGVFRALTVRTPSSLVVAHVDRRLGLGGLLLSGLERDAAAWQPELTEAAHGAAAATPFRAGLRTPSLRLVGAAGFAAAVCLLPPPASELNVPVRSRVMEMAVAEVVEQVELALEEGAISESQGRELEKRAKDLKERLLAGDPVAWNDVDAVTEALLHEEESHLAGLESVGAGVQQMLEHLNDTGSDEMTTEDFSRLMKRAEDLGLFENLPPSQRETIEKLMEKLEQQATGQGQSGGGTREEGQGLDAGDLGLDVEQLQNLLQGLKQSAGKSIRRMGQSNRIAPEDLKDLKQLLEEEGLLGKGGNGQGGPKQQQPGAGGVGRGPGDADLNYSGGSDVDTSSLKPEKLQPGATIPDDWHVLGVSRGRPSVEPVRSDSAGGAGSGGTGRSTFRRKLAPRHADAVRRFFTQSGK